MRKILIASKSCGNGIGQDKMRDLFVQSNIIATFANLEDSISGLGEYDGIVIGMDPFTEDILDKAENLKAVMKYGVGTENIDKIACANRDVKVLNMPGVNNEAVAEMAFALMVACARRVVEGDRKVRGGEWPRLMGCSLVNKTLGIIGTGAIGTKLTQLVAGFDMKVIGYDTVENQPFQALGRYVPLEQLLREADFISLHVPLTEGTYHMIGEREFGAMKSSAILINTARGPIIDEVSLFKALSDHQIGGAGLDVYEQEPLGQSPLLELDNVVCLPHIAAFNIDTMVQMDYRCIKTMADAL